MTCISHDLIAAAAAGDRDAQDRLVRENEGLVRCTVARWGRGVDIDDALSVARAAILRAAERFSPSRGAWSTCASLWMRAWLRRELVNHGSLVRVPSHAFDAGVRCPSVVDQFVDPRDERPSPCDEAARSDQAASVRRAMASLPPRVRVALAWRYGIGEPARDGMTLREVGSRLGISHEQVRGLVHEGLAMLRRQLADED